MRALKSKTEKVEFTDHLMLRVQIETELVNGAIGEEPEMIDEEMITNEELISKVNNRKINELTADESLVSEWIDETEAMMSFRDFVIRKYGRQLIERKGTGQKKQNWYS